MAGATSATLSIVTRRVSQTGSLPLSLSLSLFLFLFLFLALSSDGQSVKVIIFLSDQPVNKYSLTRWVRELLALKSK